MIIKYNALYCMIDPGRNAIYTIVPYLLYVKNIFYIQLTEAGDIISTKIGPSVSNNYSSEVLQNIETCILLLLSCCDLDTLGRGRGW